MSSNSGIRSRRKLQESSDGQSLPEEWGSVQKRLQYLQAAMIKVNKKVQKHEKRILQNEQELVYFRKDVKKNMDQVFAQMGHQILQKERQMELQNMREEMLQLHGLMKRIDKKNNQMFKEIRSSINNGYGNGNNMDSFNLDEKIDQKISRVQAKNKSYVDRAISQVKGMIKQYSKQPSHHVDIKYSSNDIQKSTSKSRLNQINQLKNSQKALKTSQLKYQQLNDKDNTSFDQRNRQKSPKSVSNNGNSRVSYLRERLRQFQQINKKYDDKSDRKSIKNERNKVEKMKEFKNYLQQSQSQLQPSQLQIKENNNVLTDSIKRWRSGNKFSYE